MTLSCPLFFMIQPIYMEQILINPLLFHMLQYVIAALGTIIMLTVGTASHYLSPEQAGQLGGGVLTRPLYFSTSLTLPHRLCMDSHLLFIGLLWRCVQGRHKCIHQCVWAHLQTHMDKWTHTHTHSCTRSADLDYIHFYMPHTRRLPHVQHAADMALAKISQDQIGSAAELNK